VCPEQQDGVVCRGCAELLSGEKVFESAADRSKFVSETWTFDGAESEDGK